METLLSRHSRAEIEKAIADLGWTQPDDGELGKLCFKRVIYEGSLTCEGCKRVYLIKNRVARFVE